MGKTLCVSSANILFLFWNHFQGSDSVPFFYIYLYDKALNVGIRGYNPSIYQILMKILCNFCSTRNPKKIALSPYILAHHFYGKPFFFSNHHTFHQFFFTSYKNIRNGYLRPRLIFILSLDTGVDQFFYRWYKIKACFH